MIVVIVVVVVAHISFSFSFIEFTFAGVNYVFENLFVCVCIPDSSGSHIFQLTYMGHIQFLIKCARTYHIRIYGEKCWIQDIFFGSLLSFAFIFLLRFDLFAFFACVMSFVLVLILHISVEIQMICDAFYTHSIVLSFFPHFPDFFWFIAKLWFLFLQKFVLLCVMENFQISTGCVIVCWFSCVCWFGAIESAVDKIWKRAKPAIGFSIVTSFLYHWVQNGKYHQIDTQTHS